MILIPLSLGKYIFAWWFGATSVPSDSRTSTKSNLYFHSYFATVMSEPALYRLLTFQVPNLMSIFLSLGHLSKESAQVQGPSWHFITSLFLQWVVSPTPNPQAGGPPLDGCLQLEYICSYLPYLEAVSSIHNLRMRHAMVTRDPLNLSGTLTLKLKLKLLTIL
jgi:hypothetical protein